MNYAILTIKLVIFCYLGYLCMYLMTDYKPAQPLFHPPVAVFLLDTVDLFIHEAGHFFLKPFGMWIHMIGGSFFQCFVPLALLAVTFRSNREQISWPGFWLGENLVNVSVYIKDAPYKHLKLIARGLIHDWNWLLSDNLDMAEPLGEAVFVLGIIVCCSAVGAGIFFAVRQLSGRES